jgi:hypothetical protein
LLVKPDLAADRSPVLDPPPWDILSGRALHRWQMSGR